MQYVDPPTEPVDGEGLERIHDGAMRILEEIGYDEIPRMLVFNKVDCLDDTELVTRVGGRDVIGISALERKGLPELLARIEQSLPTGPGLLPPTRRSSPVPKNPI